LGERAYNDDEVKEILQRAVEQEAVRDAGALTHEELVSAAGEIGISADAVERAAVELMLSRTREGDANDLQVYKRGRRLHLLRGVLVFLAAIAAALGSQQLLGVGDWVLLPLIIWAFFLSARGVSVFLQDPEKAERAARRAAGKRRRREALQRRKRARRSRPRVQPAPTPAPPRAQPNANVSKLVDEGVGLLLQVIASSHEKRRRGPQGDFGRYVKRRQGGPTRARVETEEESEQVGGSGGGGGGAARGARVTALSSAHPTPRCADPPHLFPRRSTSTLDPRRSEPIVQRSRGSAGLA